LEVPPAGGLSTWPLSSSAVRLSRWRAVLQLLLAFGAAVAGALLGAVLAASIQPGDKRWNEIIVTGAAGLACIIAVFALLRAAGQRPAAIGWRVNHVGADVGVGFLATLVTYGALICGSIVLALIRPDLMEQSTQAQRAIEKTIPRTSFPTMILMMVLVALWEEIVFRGFLLTRLYAILRRWWLAVPLGAALFAMGHYDLQGALATAVIWAVGILLGVLLAWRRSLLPGIVFHACFNIIGLSLLRSSGTWQ